MICPLLLAALIASADDSLLPEGNTVASFQRSFCRCREGECSWYVVSYPNGTSQTERIGRCAIHWLADRERARWEAQGSAIDRYEESH